MQRLQELYLDHFAIPRPGRAAFVAELQDILLPRFIQYARFAWMAASPYQPAMTQGKVDPVTAYLINATEASPADILRFSDVQEQLGLYAFLEDFARSPDYHWLASMPVDPADYRLLREAGHPDPQSAAQAYLQRAAQDPAQVAAPKKLLERVADSVGKIHHAFFGKKDPAEAGPRRNRKAAIFSINRVTMLGLAKIFSGLTTWAGNTAAVAVLPILIVTSVAGGLVLVLDGYNDIQENLEQSKGANETGRDAEQEGGSVAQAATP
jgi:hypothetical protein